MENFGDWLSEIPRVVSVVPGVSEVSLGHIQAKVAHSASTAQSRNAMVSCVERS